MRLDFVKTESIGNDFVLLREESWGPLSSSTGGSVATSLDRTLEQLAIQLCERKFGIGSDGLLLVGKNAGGLTMRMFNPDGTEDFCGNGLRCEAVYGREVGWVLGDRFNIEHGGQAIAVELLAGGAVRTVLGPASYRPSEVPHTGFGEIFDATVWSGMVGGMPLSLFGSALTTGSTHVVIPTAAIPDDESFVSISSAIEKDAQFPKHTSVIWVKELESMRLRIRIWERGACETLGCGTGSSAAAADYLRRKQSSGTVVVENPGGNVSVSAGSWDAALTVVGVAQTVYRGQVNVADGV